VGDVFEVGVKVKVDIAALGESTWREYLVRFIFGGIITVLTGLIAKRYGPEIGGLSLAFPAIFPAAATLLEKHEKQKEKSETKARRAVAVDASGAVLGAVGLAAFAFVVWLWLPGHAAAAVLSAATAAWFLVAAALWIVLPTLNRSLRAIIPKHGTAMLSESHLQARSRNRRRTDE
jgi:Protein of unknown function (DUF3147)